MGRAGTSALARSANRGARPTGPGHGRIPLLRPRMRTSGPEETLTARSFGVRDGILPPESPLGPAPAVVTSDSQGRVQPLVPGGRDVGRVWRAGRRRHDGSSCVRVHRPDDRPLGAVRRLSHAPKGLDGMGTRVRRICVRLIRRRQGAAGDAVSGRVSAVRGSSSSSLNSARYATRACRSSSVLTELWAWRSAIAWPAR